MSEHYPDGPITLIVPSSAGAVIDTVARILATQFPIAELEQPVVISNRLGANGTIARAHVAAANPDGYTLLFDGPGIGDNLDLYDPPLDPLVALVPVARVVDLTVAGEPSWFGVFAPAGTSTSAVQTLNAAINEVLSNPDFGAHQSLVNLGATPAPMSVAEFAEFVADDLAARGYEPPEPGTPAVPLPDDPLPPVTTPETVLRMQVDLSRPAPEFALIADWANTVEAATGGALSIHVFAAGELTAPSESIQAVQFGVIDLAWSALPPSQHSGVEPLVLPFGSAPGADAAEAAWNLLEAGLETLDGLQALAANVEVADALATGPWVSGDIAMQDGWRVAVPETASQATRDLLEGAGANVIPLPAGWSHAAFMAGEVDAIVTSMEIAAQTGLDEVGGQILRFSDGAGLSAEVRGLLINEESLGALRPELQAALLDTSGLTLSRGLGAATQARAAEAADALSAMPFDFAHEATWRDLPDPTTPGEHDLVLSGSIVDRTGNGMPGVEIRFTSDDAISVSMVQSDVSGGFEFALDSGASGQVDVQRPYQPGDPVLTAGMALDVLRLAVGLQPSWGPAGPLDYLAADFNGDGQITAGDALDILRVSVGLKAEMSPRWLFVDSEANLSHIDGTNTQAAPGFHMDQIPSDAMEIVFVGILIGNVQEFA